MNSVLRILLSSGNLSFLLIPGLAYLRYELRGSDSPSFCHYWLNEATWRINRDTAVLIGWLYCRNEGAERRRRGLNSPLLDGRFLLSSSVHGYLPAKTILYMPPHRLSFLPAVVSLLYPPFYLPSSHVIYLGTSSSLGGRWAQNIASVPIKSPPSVVGHPP